MSLDLESRNFQIQETLEISVIHYYKVKRRLNRKNFKKLSRAALKLLFEDLDLFIIEMISFDISVSFSLGHIGLKLASHLSTSHRFCQLQLFVVRPMNSIKAELYIYLIKQAEFTTVLMPFKLFIRSPQFRPCQVLTIVSSSQTNIKH